MDQRFLAYVFETLMVLDLNGMEKCLTRKKKPLSSRLVQCTKNKLYFFHYSTPFWSLVEETLESRLKLKSDERKGEFWFPLEEMVKRNWIIEVCRITTHDEWGRHYNSF